jgi:hypothetical protein
VYFWCFVGGENGWKQFGGDKWVRIVLDEAVKPAESSGDDPEKLVSPAGAECGVSAPSDVASGGSSSDAESSVDQSTTRVIYIGCVCLLYCRVLHLDYGCCVGKGERRRAIGCLVTCKKIMPRG